MYKNKTNEILLNYYRINGYEKTVEVAYQMLNSSRHKRESGFRSEVHGELAETVLECGVLEFLKLYPRHTENWFYSKGMILKDITKPDSEFMTELDFTLFTPYKILLFECKSYAGDKKIISKCSVTRPGQKTVDVYRQHKIHYTTFMKNFEYCHTDNSITNQIAPMQLAYFDCAIGSVVDTREQYWRNIMPIIDSKNLHTLLKTFIGKPKCWQIKNLNKAVEIVDKKKHLNTKKHLKYVKGLHGGK